MAGQESSAGAAVARAALATGPISDDRPKRGLGEVAFTLLSAVLYAAVTALYFVIPLRGQWGSRLLGTWQWAPDNILNAGILEWGYRSLWSPQRHFFDWVAGYPLTNSLAGTSNLLGWQILYSPLRVMGIGPVAAMNVLVCISFVVSGIAALAFARHLGLDRKASMCAGFVFAFLPVHLFHAIQFQSLAICWFPFALLFVDRFVSSGSLRDGAASIVLCCATFLSGMYMGTFLAITAPLYAGLKHLVGLRKVQWPAVVRLVLLGVSCAALLLPVLTHYFRFFEEHGLDDSIQVRVKLSLLFSALWTPSNIPASWNQMGGLAGGSFPGVVASILLLLGIWKAGEKRWRAHLALVSAILTVLAFGPLLQVNGSPVRLAGHYVPMLGILLEWIPGLRMPFRWLLPASLFLSALCGAGAGWLISRYGNRAFLLVMVLSFAELYPAPALVRKSVPLPPPLEIAEAYRHLDGCPVLVELPTPRPSEGPNEFVSRYVYGAAGHLHRTVSYYVSSWPPEVWRWPEIAERLPDESARKELVRAGISCVVLHQRPPENRKFASAGYQILFAGADSAVVLLQR